MPFSPAIARVLCQSSADAYKVHESGAKLVLVEPSTDTVDTITLARREAGEGARGGSAEGEGPDDSVILAFRGTADVKNWLTDLDARKLEWPVACRAGASEPMRVHMGFLDAWLSIREAVLESIDHMLVTRRIFITGHSLGGALAMLAATELHLHFGAEAIAGVYTFGQPRVGGRAFAQLYNSWLRDRTWRVVHREDLVPHVPYVLGAFHHAGHEAWYEQNDPHSLMLDRTFRQYACANLIAALDIFLRGPLNIEQWIADHAIKNYLALFPPASAHLPSLQSLPHTHAIL